VRWTLPALAFALGSATCLPAARPPPVQAPVVPAAHAPTVWTLPAVLPTVIGYTVDARYSAEEVADLAWAMQAWETATRGCVRFQAFGDDIRIVRAPTARDLPPGLLPGAVAAWDPQAARLTFAPSLVCGWGVCTLARRDVFVHELGHVLGLEHSDPSAPGRSCMTEYLRWGCAGGGVPQVDADTFCAAHHDCDCP
jgi:hypothetical protein